MSEQCSDCGGEVTRARPTRTGTGLTVEFRVIDGEEIVGSSSLGMDGWACEDCGRVRFRAETSEQRPADESAVSGSCPLCSGPTVAGQPGGSGYSLELLDRDRDVPGTDRYELFGHACVDCGAVALYADDVKTGPESETDCLACEGQMRDMSISTGSGGFRLVGDRRSDASLAPRRRVEPMAWACEDCGLTLVFDQRAGD